MKNELKSDNTDDAYAKITASLLGVKMIDVTKLGNNLCFAVVRTKFHSTYNLPSRASQIYTKQQLARCGHNEALTQPAWSFFRNTHVVTY